MHARTLLDSAVIIRVGPDPRVSNRQIRMKRCWIDEPKSVTSVESTHRSCAISKMQRNPKRVAWKYGLKKVICQIIICRAIVYSRSDIVLWRHVPRAYESAP